MDRIMEDITCDVVTTSQVISSIILSIDSDCQQQSYSHCFEFYKINSILLSISQGSNLKETDFCGLFKNVVPYSVVVVPINNAIVL